MNWNHKKTLGWQLEHCAILIGQQVEKNFSAVGLDVTFMQWRLLKLLWDEPSLSQTEIGMEVQRDKSWVTRALDEMEEKGWIERVCHATDRRVKQIRLTQTAVDLRPLLITQSKKALKHASAGVDLVLMQQCLDQIQQNLESDD